VVNSGNANAFTGKAGREATKLTAEIAAAAADCRPAEVFLASTGVIGETLPDAALTAALPALAAALAPSGSEMWHAAADAIRTTDTFAKGSFAPIEGTEAVVVGIAKGSGMIAPDMATMLAFVFTDLEVPAPLLQAALNASVERSFNRITVDSDTSTSDTVLAFATGTDGAHAGVVDSPGYLAFRTALDAVLLDLAHQIVRDGEGATKFVTVTVTGAEHEAAAKRIALSIANSPLVKTALAAEDANWGRIVMAVGKAGERADRDSLTIRIGSELVAAHGVAHPDYSEAHATEHLKNPEVDIAVDVGIGDGAATVWTCDLTHGYIDINAGYRS
jgi:glutamate N-acetyltransferase/amino-acid N-acetyltransferase